MQRSFGKDVVKLASGTTLAQLILILSAPLLTRIYAPAELGVLAVFIAISSTVSQLCGLLYERSILLPDKDEDAIYLLLISLLSCTFNTALFTLIYLLGQKLGLPHTKTLFLSPWWMVSLSIFINSTSIAFTYWHMRQKKFGILARTQVLSSVVTAVFQVLLGLSLGGTSNSLLWGYLIGSIAGCLPLIIRIRFRKPAYLLKLAKRYRKFPVYGSLGSLLNNVSWQFPPFALAFYFSPQVVGYYALSHRVLSLPMGLIGGAIGQSFFPRAVEAERAKKLRQLVEKIFYHLSSIGFLPVVLLSVVGPDVFGVFFGQEWRMAGIYTQLLSVWMFIWFISNPFSPLYSVLERQELLLKIQILKFLSRVAAVILGGLSGNIFLTLIYLSASGVIFQGYQCLMSTSIASVPHKKIFQILGRISLTLILPALLLLAAKWLGANSLCLAILYVAIVLIHLGVVFVKDFKFLLSKNFIKEST